MSKKSNRTLLLPAFEARHQVAPNSPFHTFLKKLNLVTSDDPVRTVVGPSGYRARGHCAARKVVGRANFESLLEGRVWKTLDTSSKVRRFMAHPVVLRLQNEEGGFFKYTPDAIVRLGDARHESGLVLEVKARFFLTQKPARERTQRISRALRTAGLQYALVMDSDLGSDFVRRLESLWSCRPSTGPWNPKHDLDAWDPRSHSCPSSAIETAWASAKAECDALLQKVMSRDPGDIDGLLQAA